MTIDDILALADRCYSRFDPEPQWKLREAIEQALEDATAAERERAAKVCEGQEQEYEPYTGRLLNTGYACADAIRGTK
jgi:hypothetical protein